MGARGKKKINNYITDIMFFLNEKLKKKVIFLSKCFKFKGIFSDRNVQLLNDNESLSFSYELVNYCYLLIMR